MKKRVAAGVLWFFAAWYAWNVIAAIIGVSECARTRLRNPGGPAAGRRPVRPDLDIPGCAGTESAAVDSD